MSDQSDFEDKKQVAITPEDVQECEKFFKFFEIPVPEGLDKAFKNFISEPNIQNQNELKFQLADIITERKHPVWNDEVFTQIHPEVSEARDALAFERDFETAITSSDDK